MIAMLISGGLAGLMAINAVMGEGRAAGARLRAGGRASWASAVALMGRSHPAGVLIAALLFGALYQGGAELEFETAVPREMIVVIQALVILFTGALNNMVRDPVGRMLLRFGAKRAPSRHGPPNERDRPLLARHRDRLDRHRAGAREPRAPPARRDRHRHGARGRRAGIAGGRGRRHRDRALGRGPASRASPP